MTRLIDADALLEVLNSKEIINLRHVKDLITNAPTVQREGWVSVEDRLPDDDKCVLAIVLDKDNAKGWHWQIVNYGHYDFYTFDDDHPNADEEGLVSRTGWHYGRESEGEFDYLIFELDGKVTHWTTVLDMPTAN